MATYNAFTENLIGRRFGAWTVLENAPKKHGCIRYLVQCDCGVTKVRSQQHLLQGKSTCCIKCSGKKNVERSRKARLHPSGRWIYGSGMQEKWWGDARREQYKKQNGICPLCNKPIPEALMMHGISYCGFWDHDHKTGLCRELLHPRCNSLLSFIENDASICQRSLDYLEKYRG